MIIINKRKKVLQKSMISKKYLVQNSSFNMTLNKNEAVMLLEILPI